MEQGIHAYATPVGQLFVLLDEQGRLCRSCIGDPQKICATLPSPPDVTENRAGGANIARQLDDYFSGKRHTFELPFLLEGTPFQQTVWRALCSIPYGSTVTYAELAGRVGRPNAVRAVGRANGANPLPLFVPCHRVVGSDGRLVGYSEGEHIKRALLECEGAPIVAAQLALC